MSKDHAKHNAVKETYLDLLTFADYSPIHSVVFSLMRCLKLAGCPIRRN